MDDDEPDFLMSLNDTLTCGFGASVLLFVVFVVLVTLQARPDRGPARLQQVNLQSGVSPTQEAGRSEDPLLVRVRADCVFVESLQPPAGREFDAVKLHDRRAGSDGSCVAIFRHPEPATRNLAFTAGTAPQGTVLLTVLLGAAVLPPGSSDVMELRYDAKGWPTGGEQRQVVFSINLGNWRYPLSLGGAGRHIAGRDF